MDVTLTINGLDLSARLTSYVVTEEVNYRKIITTLDDVEHAYPGKLRPVIRFSLLPLTDTESLELYNILKTLIYNSVECTINGTDYNLRMRLNSNLESVFLLRSVDGKRRYNGGEIELRSTHCAYY